MGKCFLLHKLILRRDVQATSFHRYTRFHTYAYISHRCGSVIEM